MIYFDVTVLILQVVYFVITSFAVLFIQVFDIISIAFLLNKTYILILLF